MFRQQKKLCVSYFLSMQLLVTIITMSLFAFSGTLIVVVGRLDAPGRTLDIWHWWTGYLVQSSLCITRLGVRTHMLLCFKRSMYLFRSFVECRMFCFGLAISFIIYGSANILLLKIAGPIMFLVALLITWCSLGSQGYFTVLHSWFQRLVARRKVFLERRKTARSFV